MSMATRPRLKAPPHSCDTHMHVYDRRFPQVPGGPKPPGDFPVEAYRSMQAQLGVSRVVIVQPNAYQDDNRCTLAAVAQLGADAKGVGVVKPSVSDAQLEALTRGGIRGIRFMTLPEREAQILRLPGRFIIDHVGKFLEPVPPQHPAFKSLLRLVDSGRCWVKLSAAYEVSKSGPPRYEDVGILAKALVKAAPERMLWASNWPHPTAAKDAFPDDANLLDLLLEWAPDEAVRRRILVDNPAELYGF